MGKFQRPRASRARFDRRDHDMRIVVKVGTSTLAHPTGRLNIQRMEKLCKVLSDLKNMGHEIILVSSGAIAMGFGKLNLSERPKDVPTKQASAAVGQCELMYIYDKLFTEYNHTVAQLLITAPDIEEGGVRKQNFHNTLARLLELGALPVINENDTVVTSEIKVGDNDTLGALVTNLVEADVLVILTDQQGLYTADPRKDPEAMFVSVATAGDPVLEKMAGGAASSLSKGGMITKILAAKRAARSGAGTIIASGRETDVLTRLARGELIGTHLRPSSTVLHARKQWIADHLRASGSLVLDEGAAKALVAKHTSLLPVGVIGVKGEFVRGEVVSCLTEDGCEIARGLVNYSSDDASRILRAHTEEIEERLGYMEQPEMIHRDNMVVLAGE